MFYQKGNVTTAVVTVDYNKVEELGTHSKFGQGHYRYIGNIIEDGSAIYGQSEDHPGGRSVILIDWQGDKKWIGTVITILPYNVLILSPYELLFIVFTILFGK